MVQITHLLNENPRIWNVLWILLRSLADIVDVNVQQLFFARDLQVNWVNQTAVKFGTETPLKTSETYSHPYDCALKARMVMDDWK